MSKSLTCLQWNCRSHIQTGTALRGRVTHLQPIAIFLQETRGPCHIQGYNTIQHNTILHLDPVTQQPRAQGQAALLTRRDCTSIDLPLPNISNPLGSNHLLLFASTTGQTQGEHDRMTSSGYETSSNGRVSAPS